MITKFDNGTLEYNLLPNTTNDERNILTHAAVAFQHLLNEPGKWNNPHTWLQFSNLMDVNYDNAKVQTLASMVRKIYNTHFNDAEQIRVRTVKLVDRWVEVPDYEYLYVRSLNGGNPQNVPDRVAIISYQMAYVRIKPFDYELVGIGKGNDGCMISFKLDHLTLAERKDFVDKKLVELGYILEN